MSNNENFIQIDACVNCSKTLREEWKFCPHCKTPVETRPCHHCGKTLKTVWQYCPYCKKHISNAAEIKQSYDYCNDWLRSILNG